MNWRRQFNTNNYVPMEGITIISSKKKSKKVVKKTTSTSSINQSINLTQLKMCVRCSKNILKTNFRRCATKPDGLDNVCKLCRKKIYQQRMQDKKYKKHLANLRAKNHIANRDKYNMRHKLSFQKNKKKIYARRKLYYKNNPDKLLAELHRQHIRNTLKSGKQAPEYLGCERKHLEKWFNFQLSMHSDMNMNNHGTYWHIDHVLPINKWNLALEEHKQLCFNWKNLMPLKIKTNISKSDSIDLVQIKELDRRLELFSEITGEIYSKTPVNIILAKPAIAGTSL